MADYTDNTRYSSFLIKKESVRCAAQALYIRFGKTCEYKGIHDALSLYGLWSESEPESDEDLTDIYLPDGKWHHTMLEAFEAITPFVEPGSRLVFFSDGRCWGFEWERGSDGAVTMRGVESYELIAPGDLQEVYEVVKAHAPHLAKRVRAVLEGPKSADS